jgi:ketosteroid isomerase-like protein
MKTLSKSILIVLCITLLSSAQLFGQEWSEEQKEVWAQVEGRWQAWVDGDLTKGLSFGADDARGWYDRSPAPITKKDDKPGIERWLQNNKIVFIHQHPIAIDIHGEVAIVFYLRQLVLEQKDGSEMNTQSKNSEIYQKINGKWLLISFTVFDSKTSTN